MSMKTRRLLSWLLVLVMALSWTPLGAFALEAEETEDLGASSTDEAPPGMHSGDPSGGEAYRYTLHLTHTLRWKGSDGSGRFMQESKTIPLTEEDFAGGGYPLLQLAYAHEALSVAPAPGCPEILRPEDFRDDGAGGRMYAAEIRYTLLEGWTPLFQKDEAYTGSSFRGQYEGAFDNVEFVPARSITVTIRYEYSRTGGMAGMEAHAPDVIELVLDKEGKADLVNWRVPHYEENGQKFHEHSHDNLQGFRIVLDPEQLDRFLVAPPEENATPEELEQALNRGDFNLKPDTNTASFEYQEAWDAARTAVVDGVKFTYIAPTENGGTEATTSSDEAKQYTLCAEGLTKNTDLTVYFRRDTGRYTVKHWKPKPDKTDPNQENPGDWESVKEETLPGRDGALTAAKALDTKAGVEGIQSYRALPFSQKTIQADGTTVVNIYYIPESIRVIFDTDNIYIPRQLVRPWGTVELSSINQTELNSAKAGHTFAGWQYKDTSGNLMDIPSDNLILTQDFLRGALLEGSAETAGVQVLRLYPKWEPATTTIRVTLWTEDLNGEDVTVQNTFYDFENKKENPGDTSRKITHQQIDGGSFTNVGSFEMKDVFITGESLVDSNNKLVAKIQEGVEKNLKEFGKETVKGINGTVEVGISDFYQQMDGFTILTEVVDPKTGEVSETTNATTAAANGTTQVYVYFARKEYTLAFHYYFLPKDVNRDDGRAYISTNTTKIAEFKFVWPATGTALPDADWKAIQLADSVIDNENRSPYKGKYNQDLLKTIPMTTTISAKYGADLRDVWPGAEDVLGQSSTRFDLHAGGGDYRRISWTPAAGYHKSLRVTQYGHVPGAYSTMSAGIVANTKEPTETNHLVAFWNGLKNNTYRYNYCYEVPELEKASKDNWISVKIYNGDAESVLTAEKEGRNTLYLVPKNLEIFQKYAFTDLLTANMVGLPKGINLPEGTNRSDYYAVREYTQNGTTRYYAVSRQLVAIAARPINEQNPSARPHLSLVNSTADHSTEVPSGVGPDEGYGYNTPDNPYDIYFYYTRDRFTVTYMTSGSKGTQEIGQIELPYGTTMYKDKYGLDLVYNKTNGDYAVSNGWSLPLKDGNVQANLPVCPDRAADGTAVWNFRGWGLSPSGKRMMSWNTEDAPVTISGNLRLYACWEAPTYTVTFDWNGGSSINGENAAPIEQRIPANRSFSSSGQIPRLTREGYVLTGWMVTHEVNDQTPVASPTPFQFEQPINRNLWVQAQWTPSGVVDITYTVRYLVNGTEIPVRNPQSVKKPFLPGTVVWETPKSPTAPEYKDYVPLEQNGSATLETGKENVITFYYAPPPEYRYTVRYIKWGTEEVVYAPEETTGGVTLQVTPSRAHIQKLNELGYYLTDDQGNRADSGTALWRVITLTQSGPNTVDFFVLPETYTITYRNLEIMGDDAARLNNPATYQTATGARRLNNPLGSYLVDGQNITFLGWRMVERTSEVGGTLDFPDGAAVAPSVTVQPGSRGNLVFQAVWNPEIYKVQFYPGDHGSLPGNAPEITYSGIPGNTVLKDHTGFTVPIATPAPDYVFTGWKLAEDGKTYTAAEVRDIRLVDRDLLFTAQYSAAPPAPPSDPDFPFWPDDPVSPPSRPDPEPEPEPTPPDPTPPQPEVPPLMERPVDPITGMVPYDPTVILDDLVPLAAPHLNITDHFAYITGYPAGDVRPEGNITRGEVATIFFRLMLDEYRRENWATENSFSDVSSGDWFNNAVSTCARAGIIKGYEDGTFRPNATVTRAEFAAIAARFVSEDVPGYDYFTDMDGHWARIDVARAVMAGWIKGSGRLFRPEDRLTRAETAAMVNRMINRFPDKEHLLPDMIRWPDNPEDAWYYEDIQEATNSHDYETAEFEFNEIWTILLANRDWAALEKEWADAAAAPGGEVAPDLLPNG